MTSVSATGEPHADFQLNCGRVLVTRDRAEALPLAGARAVREAVEDDLDRRAAVLPYEMFRKMVVRPAISG